MQVFVATFAVRDGFTDVKFEAARNHDGPSRAANVFKHNEAQCFLSADEQPAAESAGIPHDPLAAAVLTNEQS